MYWSLKIAKAIVAKGVSSQSLQGDTETEAPDNSNADSRALRCGGAQALRQLSAHGLWLFPKGMEAESPLIRTQEARRNGHNADIPIEANKETKQIRNSLVAVPHKPHVLMFLKDHRNFFKT